MPFALCTKFNIPAAKELSQWTQEYLEERGHECFNPDHENDEPSDEATLHPYREALANIRADGGCLIKVMPLEDRRAGQVDAGLKRDRDGKIIYTESTSFFKQAASIAREEYSTPVHVITFGTRSPISKREWTRLLDRTEWPKLKSFLNS
mmetsp:Transcript_49033/g.151423  ORF Transcript_49033/g.151423 Transcript_49033/m.151423 type:complete len:150 (-) Transcript_49033:145-594(-)